MNQHLFDKIIPKKHHVFLSEKGLTQSEANHVTNLVTELLKGKDGIWNTTGPYNQSLKIDGESVQMTNYEKIDLVASSLYEGQYNAITAWLREGIKAKDEALKIIGRVDSNVFALDDDNVTHFEQPQMPSLASNKHKLLTEDDIIAEWSIQDRCEYYTLQSLAAGVGQKIHKGRPLSILREKLARMSPNELKELPDGKGVKTFVITNSAVYTNEEVDNAYFELQEKHRGYEQRLNYLKAQIKNDLNTKNTEIRGLMQKESQDNHATYMSAKVIYDNALKVIAQSRDQWNQEYEKRRLALTKYVSQLRIAIPAAVEPWLKEINELRQVKK